MTLQPAHILLEIIKNLRRKKITKLRQVAPQGLPPQKLYEQVLQFYPILLADYPTTIRSLIEAGTLTLFGHGIRYFGDGKETYVCRCILSPTDLPTWLRFDRNNFAMTPRGDVFDTRAIATSYRLVPSQDERRQHNYVHFTQLRLYITADGLTEEVRRAIDRDRHPLRPLALTISRE